MRVTFSNKDDLKDDDQDDDDDGVSVKSDYSDPSKRFDITGVLVPTVQGRICAANDLKTGKYAVIKETWKKLIESGLSRDGKPVPENLYDETKILSKLSALPDRHPCTLCIALFFVLAVLFCTPVCFLKM